MCGKSNLLPIASIYTNSVILLICNISNLFLFLILFFIQSSLLVDGVKKRARGEKEVNHIFIKKNIIF